jgi:TolB-like protein
MASLIHGFEYDIFISYRQKDNKGDRWVSKFVDALKIELEATFKEDISVYFDENPHDRLQETHNVGKSLEGKLKCLIFIPILSQTYCDPQSYAWQYEFLAFDKMAENDPFGKDVKLRNGNVANRILPIRIHDLEPEDIRLFEKETGSVLRAMDFVFKTSSGVIRPLKENEDHPHDNLNKTFYGDQINKVSRAIKEVIYGMKAESVHEVKEKTSTIDVTFETPLNEKRIESEKPQILINRKLTAAILIIAVIALAGYFLYPSIIKNNKAEIFKDKNGKISIAVLPFENLTGDTTFNWFRRGISSLIINGLGNSTELNVCDDQTMAEEMGSLNFVNTAGISPSFAREVAKKVSSKTYISGSFQGRENTFWIMANLVDTETGNIITTKKVIGNLKSSDYLDLADSLCNEIKNYLEIRVLENTVDYDFREVYPKSAEAFRCFIEGMSSVLNNNYESGIQSLEKALAIDSTFTLASFYLIYTYWYNRQFSEGVKILNELYPNRKRIPWKYQLWVEMWNACLFGNNMEEIVRYCDLLAQSGINTRFFLFDLGVTYQAWPRQYEKAVAAFDKLMEINRERSTDWKFEGFYDSYADALHKLGKHEQEKELYVIGNRIFPESISIMHRQCVCLLSEGDTLKFNEIMTKRLALAKKGGLPESEIELETGNIYAEANTLSKAEFHYRKASELDPQNLFMISRLAYFLIEYNINLNEGLELVNKGFNELPDSRGFLILKGVGVYKQGKYDEAVKLLSTGWEKDNKLFYELYHYYEDAKQAQAKQKNN